MTTLYKRIKYGLFLRPFVVCSAKGNKRGVCLTFDDGPNDNYTIQVLDILDKFSARATFFLVGSNIQKHKGIAKQIVHYGHEVGNHTMTHKNLKMASWRDICAEINNCDDQLIMNKICEPKFLRPPKGNIGLKLLCFAILHKKQIILWNHDPKDYKAPNTASIQSYFKKNPARAGDIILLHDNNQNTVNTLEYILQFIKELSLQPVTLSELLC
jgi:peptidoglycan/xylan/chitin deacetylase (PgdA/CDA1 family)